LDTNIVIRKPSQLVNSGVFIFGTILIIVALMAESSVNDLMLSTMFGFDFVQRMMNYYWVIYVFVGLWMIYEFLVVFVTSYQITEDRLIYRHGLIIAVRDEIELFRVKDLQLTKPLIYRVFFLSTLELSTSDVTHPVLSMGAIRKGEDTLEIVRNRVEIMRHKKGVREFD
jgi:uncharacterized membrane protein YdbT with pleckstrin-like domain